MKKFDYCIFIGRFQPVHLAHRAILDKAFETSEEVIVVLGSHNKARDIKNPWTSLQRRDMIFNILTEEEKKRVCFIFMRDYLYNDNLWLTDIQNKISNIVGDSTNIALIGYESDKSSYYLKMFPKWHFISTPTKYNFHASDIRELYYCVDDEYKEYVHPTTFSYMEDFAKTKEFHLLVEEKMFLDNYKKIWEVAPFPPTFVTVDAVVIKSGHILVVRRKGSPGRGLIALPGGFLQQNEDIETGVIRELKEETGINIAKDQLHKSIVDKNVFGHPLRSLRGRTITHAYCFNLGSGNLPVVKGNDDADKAWWMPLSEVYSREYDLFEDHSSIVSYFCSRF
jgi:bifunctional NMN adenylyltransferase/nudix hydrolase